MKNALKRCTFILPGLICLLSTFSQNPIIRDQFSADPTARVFGDKVYLYPSHDIPVPANAKVRKDWFCMADYHVFSSFNFTNWTDHGTIVSQNKVQWVDSTGYSMWAPDCIERNGKYYMYFPAPPKGGKHGFAIGVAIADNPAGPFVPEANPIKNVNGIDPNVFIDKDGQVYLYWAMGNIYGARLKDNMVELDSEPAILKDLPIKGLKEGPFLFERNGIYYMTFPHVEDQIERLEYSMGNNPLGPFKMKGVIMDESPVGCWTNHHSVINFKGQWYLFYHSNDLSPKFDKNRSVRIDSLSFNADGTIRKVVPTYRGVGLTPAAEKIQIDRYSSKSDVGVSIEFIDSINTFGGWKTVFNAKGAWIQYNAVNFGIQQYKSVIANVISARGGELQLRLNGVTGPVIARIVVTKSVGWRVIKFPVAGLKPGIQNLCLTAQDDKPVEIDWIRFE
jgi:Beta-xylosidase